LASSIIFFIISASGVVEVVVLVAGLMAGLVVVVVVVDVAGLEVVAGALGAAVGLCAKATEAVANKAAKVFSKVVGLMVAGILLRPGAVRQARGARKARFLLVQQS
jgi:hypothetical protein